MSIESMKQALDVIETAIKAGDWKVDGACDPDNVIHGLRQAIAELESQYPHGMYGAEDLDKAWKSGYDNCKDQYAYLDEQEPVAWADHGVVNWIADKQFKHRDVVLSYYLVLPS